MNCWDLYDLEPSGDVCLSYRTTDSYRTKADCVSEALSNGVMLTRMKQLVWEAISSKCTAKDVNEENMDEVISKAIMETGIKNILASITVRLLEKNRPIEAQIKPRIVACTGGNDVAGSTDSRPLYCRFSEHERMPPFKTARLAWEQGINEELVAIAAEKKKPFANLMSGDVLSHPLLEEHVSLAARQDVRFLFDSDDLLDTIVRVRPENIQPSYIDRTIGLIKMPLRTPTLQEVSQKFPDLCPSIMHVGIDDDGSGQHSARFFQSRLAEAQEIIASGSVLEARRFLTRGCPPAFRGSLWRMAHCLPPSISRKERLAFLKLKDMCNEIELLTDDLYVMDVITFCDDTRYFVFEDKLRLVALCFSRDEWVSKNSQYQVHKPLTGQVHLCGHRAFTASTPSPPCGLQPFLGFAAYLSPLCYLYGDSADLYSVCRAWFCGVWCRMNVISGDEGCLPHICAIFESLLLQVDLRLFLHLARVGVQPLHVALPWLQLGFVGYLEVDQILMLWDRILGYMDTTLLAVLAAAIFVYRSETLMKCDDAAEVNAVLMEGSHLKVLPLLQFFLFSDK
mmetsp:Transcript_403/g.755  ORF Transcript_403/g.755 Transcript_403/m.755 type:complete len:566 (+) Transcript_403:85-1782(+)